MAMIMETMMVVMKNNYLIVLGIFLINHSMLGLGILTWML